MRALNVLLSILISLAMGLLVFELGLGLMPSFREQVRLSQFDPLLGWSKKPNHSGRRSSSEFDIHFQTNAQGLREPADTPLEKPADTYRVLLLGDSFVLGYTVEEREVFASKLEELWRAQGRSIEVLNAGTEGYSTDQEALWLKTRGLDFQPDLVLLFPYENDLYWNSQSEYNGSPKPRFGQDGRLEQEQLQDPGRTHPWHQDWATGRFLQYLARQLLGSKLGPSRGFELEGVEGRISNEFAPLLLEPHPLLDDCLRSTRTALASFRDTCAQAGLRCFLVPIPSESAIHAEEREAFRLSPQGLGGLDAARWSPDRPVDLFLSMAAELGIPSMDPRVTLRERGAEQPLYYQEEWHLNPAGNLALAQFLREELDARNVIPGRFAARSSTPIYPEESAPATVQVRYLVFALLWLFLGTSFCLTYPKENKLTSFLKVGLMLAFIFTLVLGSRALLARYPSLGLRVGLPLILLFVGFLLYKLGRRLGTILELLQAFTMRGHWYLMPLVMVLLSIGSLLVVAASSPLIAPFIYTLF